MITASARETDVLPSYVRDGPPQGQWTVADVAVFPEDDGYRYEIIDGVLLMTTQPHWRHQGITARLTRFLDAWSDEANAGVGFVAPGVIFADDQAVAPDIIWVRHDRLAVILNEDGKLHGPPDLVIEVLSPGKANVERDRDIKLDLYRRQGVAEYWIVDRFQRQVEAYRSVDGGLNVAQVYTAEDTLTSPLLPGCACAVARLFR